MNDKTSNFWPKFSKENPCPSCGHAGDWLCRMGEKKYICMRVASSHPVRGGGWYHEYSDKTPKPKYIPPIRKVKHINFEALYGKTYNTEGIEILALEFGVSVQSLIDLGFCKSGYSDEWRIPMRDGDNKIIGIQLRGETKRCVVGSKLGLFIPQISPAKIAYICEGASDTAALVTIGYYAVGRPSCCAGGDMLKVLTKRLGITHVVFVVDNDEIKQSGTRPGYEGVKKLRKELGLMSIAYLPPSPIKDIRELLNRVGPKTGKLLIDSAIEQSIWTRI